MIENEIYSYINGFMKWNISKKTSYIVGNKKFLERFALLISERKEKVSLQEKSLGTKGERRSQRKRTRL